MVSARFRVAESSQQGEARRAASAQARAIGFDEDTVGRVAVVASELAGNLIKHVPSGGELLIGSVKRGGAVALELVAIDRGPGIGDFEQALRDGFSTAGSQGTGLGAVARLSDAFDIHTTPKAGTAIVARIWRDGSPPEPEVAVGAVCVAMVGERLGGDSWSIVDLAGKTRILVVDGLGHGADAEVAAARAVELFEDARSLSPGDELEDIHRALRPTRGAAVALAEIDFAGRSLRYAAVGNIAGAVVSRGEVRHLVSHNGIVGHNIRRIQEFVYEIPSDALIILTSDGVKTRWSLDGYPGLTRRDPTLVAAVLFRDFERGHDDVTALVARL
jgi:anti-sigma regulatory factor (Ser/Thr protein kinase)